MKDELEYSVRQLTALLDERARLKNSNKDGHHLKDYEPYLDEIILNLAKDIDRSCYNGRKQDYTKKFMKSLGIAMKDNLQSLSFKELAQGYMFFSDHESTLPQRMENGKL